MPEVVGGRILSPNLTPDDWRHLQDPPPLTLGMGYEYDPAKETSNRDKHGCSLEGGRELLTQLTFPPWTAPPVVGLGQPPREDGETRYRLLALDHECHVVDFVFAIRGTIGEGDYRMRGISLRREHDAHFLALYQKHTTLIECLEWRQHCIAQKLLAPTDPWPLADLDKRTRLLIGFGSVLLMARNMSKHATFAVTPSSNGDSLERLDVRDHSEFKRITISIVPNDQVGLAMLDYMLNGARGMRYYYMLAGGFNHEVHRLTGQG